MPILTRPGQPDIHYALDDYTDPWKNAPYLILQHGFGRSGKFWYSWVPYLARWFKVVRPDVRGLGQSPATFDLQRDFTVENCVADLAAIIDHLEAESVHYCGESMGGILGMVLAAMHPARVRTLTLVSSPVYIGAATKKTYALGHESEAAAQKAMGMQAWVAATNRTTRFPPETDPGLLAWYEEEFAKNRVSAAHRSTGAGPLSDRRADHERRSGSDAQIKNQEPAHGASAVKLPQSAARVSCRLCEPPAAFRRAARRHRLP
jgi:3-oxoadipate enol-lactonase